MRKGGEEVVHWKMIIIGDSAVGKSSLIGLYHRNELAQHQQATLSCEYLIHSESVNGRPVKLLIWDTAGQEKYRTMTQTYLRGAKGILLVYSVADRASFDNVRRWMDDVVNTCSAYSLVLIGNKCDLVDARTVSSEEGGALAASLGVPFFETTLFEEKRPPHAARIAQVFRALLENIAARDKSLQEGGGETDQKAVGLAAAGKKGTGCGC